MHLKPKPISLSLSLSLSLSFSFGYSIFFETGMYKIIGVITWKINIEWRKPFIFEINEIKSGRIQEVRKGGGAKSLKLVINKKMRWGERLNKILLI